MTNIIILGAGGRMGQLLIRAAMESVKAVDSVKAIESGATLTAAVVRSGNPLIGKQASPSNIVFTDDAAAAMKKNPATTPALSLAIDFSMPDAVANHAALAAEHGVAYLCGVTGLDDEAVAGLQAMAKKIPILLAPNTSLGVAGFARVVALATGLFDNYDVRIVETHHIDKKDKPSGTALMLGRVIEKHSNKNNKDSKIDYESIREGAAVGTHDVIFDSGEDSITLRHMAKDRKMFAVGAVRAGLWLRQQPNGFYSISDFLK